MRKKNKKIKEWKKINCCNLGQVKVDVSGLKMWNKIWDFQPPKEAKEPAGVANREYQVNSRWAGLMLWPLGPVFSHGYRCPWTASAFTGSSHFLVVFCADATWRQRTRSVVFERWKVERARLSRRNKKRKVLETDAAEYAKIWNFFTKTSSHELCLQTTVQVS